MTIQSKNRSVKISNSIQSESLTEHYFQFFFFNKKKKKKKNQRNRTPHRGENRLEPWTYTT